MADAEVQLLKLGAVLNRRYQVIRLIKIGGMGAIYEVTDQSVGKRRRALKVMLPGLVTEPMRERFRLEAALPGRIESDNVVDVVDQGVDDETQLPYFVMEFLKGEDLESQLRRGALPPSEAVLHLYRASFALDCAHAADIVHRDLKPENLFITKQADGTEGLKVLDFGIAKIVAENARSRTTLNLGTPLYMSPEQIMGEGDIGQGSDIYSLGHVAFTLLTGHAYWEPEVESMASTPFLARVALGATEPATARAARLGASLPPAFDAWFLRATAVSAGERFESASELVEELAEALGVPVQRPNRISWPRVDAVAKTLPAPATPVGRPHASPIDERVSAGNTGTGAVSSSAGRRRERATLLEWFVAGILGALVLVGGAYAVLVRSHHRAVETVAGALPKAEGDSTGSPSPRVAAAVPMPTPPASANPASSEGSKPTIAPRRRPRAPAATPFEYNPLDHR